MTLPAPRAIIFDWDNTLVDTWPVIHEALSRTFTATGKTPWSLEDVKARVRKSMRDSFPEIFGANWEEVGQYYQQQYRAIHLEQLQALPGAEATLRYIQRVRIPALVVSNKKGMPLRKEVEHLGWSPLFAAVVGSDDAPRDKPHPDPVELALSHINIPPAADIWFVGDSEIDLDCAARTGCTPILYGEYAAAHPSFTATHYLGFLYQSFIPNHDMLERLLR